MKEYAEIKKEYKRYGISENVISNVYGLENITLTRTEYVKRGNTWKETEKTEKVVDFEHYLNILSASPFMRNLGGYERQNKAYTRYGYIPNEVISISPSRDRKSVFFFTFSNSNRQ